MVDVLENPPVVPGFAPPVPDFNTQSDDEFSDNAQRMVNELPPFHAGMTGMANWMNTAAQYVYQLSQQVEAGAISSEEFALIARSFANFKGLWSSLSGAEVVGISVEHNNKIWMLRQAVVRVQDHEPLPDSPVWRDTTIDTGILVVTTPTDTRPGRVVDTQWDFEGAVLRQEWPARTEAGWDLDYLPPGYTGFFPLSIVSGVVPPGNTVAGWNVSCDALYGGAAYQFAYSFAFNSAGVVPEMWMRMRGSSDANFAGVQWYRVSGGGSPGSSFSEPVTVLPVPVRSLEYVVGGSVYGVDINLDFSAANVFQGYSTTTTSQLPAGASAPLGMSGANGFRLRFNLQNLPADGATTMVKYLRWAGFLRAGGGGGILDFSLPAGWSWVWQAGENGTVQAPRLSAANTVNAATAKYQELQFICNGKTKLVSVAAAGYL